MLYNPRMKENLAATEQIQTVEYKVFSADDYAFMAVALVDSQRAGSIVAHNQSQNQVNLHHLLVDPNYRGELKIAYNLHQQMVAWASQLGHLAVTLEVVPKNPEDYERTVKFIERLGYECKVILPNGYKFGFVKSLIPIEVNQPT